uniref:SSD domain-containing protein n=1 Tax=Heterorhabditis bacteriophora TaxID=37862 RepID=A0A1I7XPR2_HETBA
MIYSAFAHSDCLQKASRLSVRQIISGPKFVLWIIGIFKKWGFIIADHAWLAIGICLIVSSLATIKILLTPECMSNILQHNDITGYTPYGARAKDEYQQYQNFFASQGLPVAAYLFVIAKDNGSMLRPEYMEEAVQVLNYAMNNVTILDRISGKNESYNQFCSSFCQVNEPIRQFYNGYQILSEPGTEPTSRLRLNYPISSIFGRTFSLQPNFFGVALFDDTNDIDVANLLSAGDDGSIKLFNKSSFIYSFNHFKNLLNFMLSFNSFMKYQSSKIKVFAYSQSYVEEEMVRGGIIMLPYLIVGFGIMCVCSVISVMTRALYMHQENCYKIALAIMACLTPLLACSTALSLMFLSGVRFGSILCVIPFLVLSIGVDSSYLMIHEWQRVTEHMRETPKKADSVGQRMSEVLSEVGPAILISCLTNMFADAVGSFTSSPEITLLCTGNMLSMLMAFVYQMTFYAGLMSVVGRYEIGDDIVDKNRMEISIAENRVNIARHHRPLTRQPSKFHETTKPIISKFMQRYVGFMTTPIVFVSVCLMYVTYLTISIYLDKLRIEYQVPHYSMATVFINNPGNLSESNRLTRMNKFVADLERLNGSWGQNWGPVGTNYFMRDYANFQQTFGDDAEEDIVDSIDENVTTTTSATAEITHFSDDELRYFLKWPEYDFWSGFVRLKNETTNKDSQILDRFFFTTGFHGKLLSDWGQRGKMLQKWRTVVDNYTEFEPSVYHEDGVYLDLIDNMPTDTWQSVLGTLVCMAFVCFIFLNNLFTVAIASLSVLSICAGILGILSLWGIDLDPITMAAMIISIGFSVDIPAHVSYHYYQASIQEGPTSRPADRLANCLSSVAFPAVQAALSTILCVSSLLFVNLYMAEVFVKTMVLCVLLCNFHGLVFLPAILILLDSFRWAFRPKGFLYFQFLVTYKTQLALIISQNINQLVKIAIYLSGAAAQPNYNSRKPGSRGKQKNSKVVPEKSSVTDRPEV